VIAIADVLSWHLPPVSYAASDPVRLSERANPEKRCRRNRVGASDKPGIRVFRLEATGRLGG